MDSTSGGASLQINKPYTVHVGGEHDNHRCSGVCQVVLCAVQTSYYNVSKGIMKQRGW